MPKEGQKVNLDRRKATEQLILIEQSPEGAFLISQALRYQVTPYELSVLVADHMGIAETDIAKMPDRCPDALAFKNRLQATYHEEKRKGSDKKTLQAYIEKLEAAALPLSDEGKREAITKKVRELIFKRRPQEFWYADPTTRLLSAALLDKGLSPELLAKALSIYLSPDHNEGFITNSGVRGWAARIEKKIREKKIPEKSAAEFLRSGIPSDQSLDEEVENISERLRKCIDARYGTEPPST